MVKLESDGIEFDVTAGEAKKMLVISDILEHDNHDAIHISLTKSISPEALRHITDFLKHHSNEPTIAQTPIISDNLSDYMTTWDAQWVLSLNPSMLKEVTLACHMLHFDEAKRVCLYRMLINMKIKLKSTLM